MPVYFPCPYLGAQVELTDERESHIQTEHQDLLPYIDRIGDVLREPDIVRRPGPASETRVFARWYDDLVRPKYIVVAVVSHQAPERYWIVTAYMAHRLTGDVEWKRS